jgi:outer membrane immunogenic protein
MKLNTIGGLAISTLLIVAPLSVASAADMALKAPPPPPAPVYGWSACYIGSNAGGAWARKSTVVTSVAGVPITESEGSTNPSGGAIGGQVGCDYQVNNFSVLGVRGMWDGANLTGSNSWPAPPTTSNNYKIDSFGTAVAKVGVLVSPAVELYAVGGAAWVHDKLNITSSVFGPLWTGDQSRTGYDAGVGITWMFAPKWDLWVEYDHMGFGTKNMSLAGVGNNRWHPPYRQRHAERRQGSLRRRLPHHMGQRAGRCTTHHKIVRVAFAETQSPGIARSFLFGCVASVSQWESSVKRRREAKPAGAYSFLAAAAVASSKVPAACSVSLSAYSICPVSKACSAIANKRLARSRI